MKSGLMPLTLLKIGGTAKVKRIEACGSIRRRMLDLGLIEDTKVESLHKSPSGDPVAYRIRGAVIALRSEEASKILVMAN